MSRLLTLFAVALLSACASQAPKDQSDAVEDFVEINDLEEVKVARTLDQFDYDYLSERYVVVETRRKYYLVEFHGRCRELTNDDMDIQPDFRYDAKAIRAGEDTIRGCRIKTMYEIDKVQAMELKHIGLAPGEERKTKT